MNKLTIAVTGVGGGVGQSIIKSLYDTNYEVIGLDGDNLATGLFATKEAHKIPYATNSEYISNLLEICEKTNSKLLFPGLDAELSILSQNVDKFAQINTKVIVSSLEVVNIADNKLLTYEFLKTNGFPAPYTLTLTDYLSNPSKLNFPFIIKPKEGGARSKNVYIIRYETDLAQLLALKKLNTDEYVAQEYIDGDEYTCGSINFDGKCHGIIIMKRILRDGDTYKCFSVSNPEVEEVLHNVYSCLKPFGACNIQFRLRDGIPYIFEINARCSGTTASRTLAGFNEPKMIADFLLQGTIPTFQIQYVSILRYWKELVVENEMVLKLSMDKQINNPNFVKL
jgi:carbamoyl-phosphate synthase large subunit